jgi:hypothetical protein
MIKYSGIDTFTFTITTEKDFPELVKVELYKDGVFDSTIEASRAINPIDENAEQLTYNPIVVEWPVTGNYCAAAKIVVTSLVDGDTWVVESDEFEIQRKIAVSGIALDTITITGAFIDETGKTVTVDGEEATVVSQDATSITFTPVTPLLLTGEYSITVTLADGSTQLYTWKFGTFVSAGRMRTNVSVKVGF